MARVPAFECTGNLGQFSCTFRRVDTSTARVIVLEGEETLLPEMSEKAGRRARKQLEELGVEVRTGSVVTGMEDAAVLVGEDRVPAENVTWAAGVQGAPIATILDVELDDKGRAQVEADCSIPGHPNAFVIGGLAHLEDPDPGAAGARAVADIREMTLTGFLAWALWSSVHILYLVGFRKGNRRPRHGAGGSTTDGLLG